MRGVFGLVLIAGVALAGSAVYLAQGYISAKDNALAAEQAERKKTGPLVQVYAVNKPLAYGVPITKDDVQTIYLQENFLPEGVFHTEEELFPDNGKEQRFVMRALDLNEPILATKVTEPGQIAGLNGQLTKGMRAFAIKVDVASGVSGFLQPGDRIDVYWTGASATSVGEITQLIESAVKIVAVDQMANGERAAEATIARTVTVEATPEQVGRLAQAQATGRLALSLVGNGDVALNGTVEVDGNGLLGISEQEIVQAEEAEVCTVTVTKGGVEELKTIACTN
jgi:pilus assembly protein CpaB